MRSSSSMRRKEGTAFLKGKIVARPTLFVQTIEGRRSICMDAASLELLHQPAGGRRRALLPLGGVHLLVDVRLILAARRTDAIHDARDDVLIMLLGIVEAVEVA